MFNQSKLKCTEIHSRMIILQKYKLQHDMNILASVIINTHRLFPKFPSNCIAARQILHASQTPLVSTNTSSNQFLLSKLSIRNV